MDPRGRPLSPHLQVYKPQLTSVLSILHRITGVVMAFGTFVFVWWLMAAALGGEAYSILQEIFSTWFGRLLLFGWSFALFYHLCNGIRHLFWDIGKGFDLTTAYRSGWIVITSATILTFVVWVCAYTSIGKLL